MTKKTKKRSPSKRGMVSKDHLKTTAPTWLKAGAKVHCFGKGWDEFHVVKVHLEGNCAFLTTKEGDVHGWESFSQLISCGKSKTKKPKNHDGWCLRGPDGKLYPDTFESRGNDRWVCWIKAYPKLYSELKWGNRSYKGDALRRVARKAGYRLVKVQLGEMKP